MLFVIRSTGEPFKSHPAPLQGSLMPQLDKVPLRMAMTTPPMSGMKFGIQLEVHPSPKPVSCSYRRPQQWDIRRAIDSFIRESPSTNGRNAQIATRDFLAPFDAFEINTSLHRRLVTVCTTPSLWQQPSFNKISF
jgi:hypothetical protein